MKNRKISVSVVQENITHIFFRVRKQVIFILHYKRSVERREFGFACRNRQYASHKMQGNNDKKTINQTLFVGQLWEIFKL